MKKFIVACLLALGSLTARAACPVCTAGIAAGVVVLEEAGVDLLLIGLWAGAFTLVMFFWTAKWLAKRKTAAIWYVVGLVAWYVMLFGIYFFSDRIKDNFDRFTLGAVIGTAVMYAAERINHRLIKNNGGKSRFRFQKIVVPLGAMTLTTLLGWLLLEVA